MTGPWVCQPTSAVVNAGAEFDLNLGGGTTFFDVDLDAWTIDLIHQPAAGGIGMGAGEVLTLSGLDSIFITGFSLQTAGNVNGFTSSDITFTPHSFDILLNGSNWFDGASARITIEGRELTVPEPATLTLLSLGAIGAWHRRSRRRSNSRVSA